MNIQGKLYAKFDTQQITDSFRKREFVVEYAENPLYPQYVKFDLIQDKCDLIDNFELGETLEVFFNLKGREWTSPDGAKKYFNTLDAWKIQKMASEQPAAGADDAIVYDLADVPGGEDDLPF